MQQLKLPVKLLIFSIFLFYFSDYYLLDYIQIIFLIRLV